MSNKRLMEDMQKEAEEARKLLEQAAEPEPQKTPEELAEEERLAAEKAAEDARKAQEKKDRAAAAASAPTGEVAALKAEISGLKQMLANENDPTWQRRYESVKGMLDGQGAEIKSLREELTALKAKPAEPETDEAYDIDVKEIGEAAAKLRKAERDRHATETAALRKEIEDLKTALKTDVDSVKARAEDLEKAAGATAAERNHQKVLEAVPDWTDLMGTPDKQFANQHPKVTEYLRQEYRGRQNFADLDEAYKRGDVATVAQICSEARKFAGLEKTPEASSEEGKGKEALMPSERAKENLEPGRTSAAVKEPTDKKETIPESEWTAFNDSITRKTFRGTITERLALQEKYKTAALEGRILWGR